MHVAIDLNARHLAAYVGRGILDDDDAWFVNLTLRGGDEEITFYADSLDALDALWQAIRDAVEQRRAAEPPASSEAPACTCRDAASTCGACLAGGE